MHAGAHVPCAVLPQPASVVAGRWAALPAETVMVAGGACGVPGGAAETVHHEVRTAVHRQLLEGKGKPSVLPYLLMYIPRTLTTLTLPEL